MKRAALILVTLSMFQFFWPPPSLASDYIAAAAEALSLNSVYVAPNTEGTDRDTAAKLKARLHSGDYIVLVMLPSTAETELGLDISAIAMQLSERLGHQRIIGLAVGDEVVAYAPTLPAGIASDQMRRASSVSQDAFTALGTFAQNIHRWQATQPSPSPASGATSNGTRALLWWMLFPVLLLLVIVISVTIYLRRKPKEVGTQPTWEL
jgi:hypothetical protein